MLIPIYSARLMKFGENIHGIQGQMWYLIVSVPDLCHLIYFEKMFYMFLKAGADGIFS